MFGTIRPATYLLAVVLGNQHFGWLVVENMIDNRVSELKAINSQPFIRGTCEVAAFSLYLLIPLPTNHTQQVLWQTRACPIPQRTSCFSSSMPGIHFHRTPPSRCALEACPMASFGCKMLTFDLPSSEQRMGKRKSWSLVEAKPNKKSNSHAPHVSLEAKPP